MSLALSRGDRALLKVFTTSDLDEARAAWLGWKRDHPLDDATSRELRMLPAVMRRLLSLGIEDPDLGRMRGITRFLWLWSQHATRASLEAADILAGDGIEVMALKGLALHALGLSSCAERPITDGDLLVSGDLSRAYAQLAAHGWRLTRRQKHAWVCAREPREELDLHQYCVQQDPRSGAWSMPAATRLERAPFRVPSPAHLIVQACWHGVREGGSLLWVLDVLRVIEGCRVDWQELSRLARERCFGLLLADALGVVAHSVPDRALQEVRALPVSPLEALEYAHAVGCSAGPWTLVAKRASLSMRELRRHHLRLDEVMLDAEGLRVRAVWQPTWPRAWQRPEPPRTEVPRRSGTR